MTDFGYGRYTTMDELDYKFFEDIRAEHIIFDLVREIAALREFSGIEIKHLIDLDMKHMNRDMR